MKKGLISYFIRFVQYLKPYKKRYIISFIFGILAITLFNLEPYLLKVLIDDILVSGNFTQLWGFLVLFLAIFSIALLFVFINVYLNTFVREKFSLDLTTHLFKKLEESSLKKIKEKDAGTILTTIIDDADAVKDFTFSFFDNLVPGIFTILYVFVIMLLLNWKLTVLGLGVLPLMIISQLYFGRVLTKKSKILRRVYSNFFSYLEERIHHLKHIKLFRREKYERQIVIKKGEEVVEKVMDIAMKENMADTTSTFLSYFALVIVLGYGGYLVIQENLTIGAFVAVFTYFFSLIGSIDQLFGVYLSLKEGQASTHRVSRLLDSLPPIKDSPHGSILLKPKGVLALSHVNFAYNSEQVLKGISISFEPGKIYGLIGPSGSGKTTILNLFYRFYDPQKGSVTFDGVDIRNIKLESLRKEMAFLDTDPILFNVSVKANIAYGDLKASFAEIRRAAELANAHEFIMSLPFGYDTKVGSFDTRLSKGQKKRIAIARVFLRDAKVCLFDEITASLDLNNEKHIIKSLKYLAEKEGKTIIVVTNRIPMMKAFDHIFVLGRKKIVEQGNFYKLFNKKRILPYTQ